MIVYFILFLFFTLLSLTHFVDRLSFLKSAFCFVSFLIIWLFAGLRGFLVGVDGDAYVRIFLQIPDLVAWLSGGFEYIYLELYMEFGYIFLNSFLKVFTSNYSVLFLFVAGISIGINFYFFYSYSRYTFLTILLYFSHTFLYRDIGQIRSGIACAIGLFLISQIHKRQHIRIITTILVASLFHLAATSFFLVYFLSFFKLTRKRIIVCVIFAAFVGFLGTKDYLALIFPHFGVHLSKIFFNYYLDSRYSVPLGIFDITNLKNLFFLIVILLFWKKLLYRIPYFYTIVLFLFLSTFWRLAFSDFAVFAGRIATFYGIVEVIIVPYFLLVLKQKIIGLLLVILYAFLTLYLNVFTQNVVSFYYTAL